MFFGFFDFDKNYLGHNIIEKYRMDSGWQYLHCLNCKINITRSYEFSINGYKHEYFINDQWYELISCNEMIIKNIIE